MTSIAESSTAPHRRWFRFSLRFLLLLVAIIGVPLGMKMNRVRNQQAVVASLVQTGAKLKFDLHPRSINGVNVTGIQEPPGPQWLREILGDKFFTELTDIQMPPRDGKSQVTDDELSFISRLPYLERLTIRTERISVEERTNGDGLAHLARLNTLQSLSLWGFATDADASHIAKINQLENLKVSDSPITDLQVWRNYQGSSTWPCQERLSATQDLNQLQSWAI